MKRAGGRYGVGAGLGVPASSMLCPTTGRLKTVLANLERHLLTGFPTLTSSTPSQVKRKLAQLQPEFYVIDARAAASSMTFHLNLLNPS